jgi:alkyl hydroperoxide reductase subunit AhpC
VRGTFLIDTDGMIRFAERLAPGVGRSPGWLSTALAAA